MASADDVKALAALARIRVEESELATFAKEFDAILAYVGKLEGLDLPTDSAAVPEHRNVLRDDGEPHAKGKWTAKLVEQFPDEEGNALSVKQIISHD